MEKFILLFRGSDVYEPDQSPEALINLKLKMMDWLENLTKKGMHVSSEQFLRTGNQVFGGKKNTIDNPFGEAREVIGGCTIIQAKDEEQAIKIAKACPILESNATIEIRPIQSI